MSQGGLPGQAELGGRAAPKKEGDVHGRPPLLEFVKSINKHAKVVDSSELFAELEQVEALNEEQAHPGWTWRSPR